MFIDHRGKRKAKCVGSKQAAETAAKKIEAKLTLGDFTLLDDKPQRPFDVYFRHWPDTYVTAHCKERTYDLYEAAFRLYLLPTFGQEDITAITREEVKMLAYTLLAQGKSRSTVSNVLAPLRGMFSSAMEDEHAERNPCLHILKRARKEERERKRKADFLTREELGVLLRTCQEHFPASYPLLSSLARTGVRFGEALALQWGDMDWHGQFIEVRRTLSKGRLTTPKSGKARRVDMNRQLTETLKVLLVGRKKDTLRKGWGEVPEWVFCNGVGAPIDAGSFYSRVWHKLLTKAELRHIRIHDLRHTFASLLIQQGESLAYVKDQLGHHSIKVTVDTYGHLIPGGNRQAVDKLDGLENTTIRNPDATSPMNAIGSDAVSA